MTSINRWVAKMKSDLPGLLSDNFPGKQDILEAHDKTGQYLDGELVKIKKEIHELEEIIALATKEKDALKDVKVHHFRRSLGGDGKSIEMVHRYMQGVFPEWGNMPVWFKSMLAYSGDAENEEPV